MTQTQIDIIHHSELLRVSAVPAVQMASRVMQAEGLLSGEIRIVLVDDAYLRQLHAEYLNDDSNTDVMTFNLGDEIELEGEIYISVERAAAHATEFQVSAVNEVARLIIHGLLHLGGYDDQTPEERQAMRSKEDHYLTANEDLVKEMEAGSL